MNINSQKGLMTEIKCQYDFSKYGIMLSQPIAPDSRYDFIADINGKLIRIQVKHACDSHIDEGYITFKTSNKTTKNGEFVKHQYTEEQIDYFATFYDGKCYLIPVSETGSSMKSLRFKPPANNQTKGITFAKDYELQEVIKKIVGE